MAKGSGIMNKYILGIDGMGCGMCEMHVEEEVSKHLKIKKAKANHIKNTLLVFSEENYTIEDFKNVLDPTGYKITSFTKTAAIKRFLGWK